MNQYKQKSIKELRKICQGVHKGDFSAQIVRKVSIYITFFLVKTNVTGNQISLANVLVGLLAGYAFTIGSAEGLFIGVLLFWLNTILDGVDGEVARFRKESSLLGLFLDRINSIFIYMALFCGIGVGLYNTTNIEVVFFGFIAAWGMLGLRLLKTYIDATLIDALTLEKAKQDKTIEENTSTIYSPVSELLKTKKSFVFLIIDFITVRQPGMAVLLSLVYIFDLIGKSLGGSINFFELYLIFYCFLNVSGLFYGIYYVIKNKTIESQYLSILKIINKS